MEDLIRGLLKELEGKNLTKKSLFEILSEINIEKTSEKNEVIEGVSPTTVIPEPEAVCESCGKLFMKKWYYTKHLKNNPVCVDWQNHPNKDDGLKLEDGLHILVNKLVEKSFTNENNQTCRWCKSNFTSIGNLHKHFTHANVCNRMSFYEFKRLINDIN
jgi:hypothetical protein